MKLIFTSVVWLTCFFMLPVYSAYTPDEKRRAVIDRPAVPNLVGETELFCMTLALYFEGGSTGESEEGQRHIARVIAERAKENRRIWGGRTICGVVFHYVGGVCQFSFACLPRARRIPRKGSTWRVSATIAREALAGRNHSPDALIRYYMNSSLTPLRNVCRFRREFVPVVRAGRHEFFREPTSAERHVLARTPFEACTRHQAQMVARRAKANRRIASGKRNLAKRLASDRLKRMPRRSKVARLKR